MKQHMHKIVGRHSAGWSLWLVVYKQTFGVTVQLNALATPFKGCSKCSCENGKVGSG